MRENVNLYLANKRRKGNPILVHMPGLKVRSEEPDAQLSLLWVDRFACCFEPHL
jgi:hypothetical protein